MKYCSLCEKNLARWIGRISGAAYWLDKPATGLIDAAIPHVVEAAKELEAAYDGWNSHTEHNHK